MILLGTVPKKSREEIRMTADTFMGYDIINIRVKDRDNEGEMRPGKQGLAFRTDLIGEVLDAVGKAQPGGVA